MSKDPFNPERDDMLGTFHVNEDQGVVTNFLAGDGRSVKDPREAVEAVGFILEGPNKGKWLRFASEPEEWTRPKRH